LSYKPGIIIRSIKTGYPLRVIRSYPGGTIVVDPNNNQTPTPSLILQEKDYNLWVDEKKLSNKEKKDSWYEEPKIIWKVAIAL